MVFISKEAHDEILRLEKDNAEYDMKLAIVGAEWIEIHKQRLNAGWLNENSVDSFAPSGIGVETFILLDRKIIEISSKAMINFDVNEGFSLDVRKNHQFVDEHTVVIVNYP